MARYKFLTASGRGLSREVPPGQRLTKRFGVPTYYLYGKGETRRVALLAAQAVRIMGGLARATGKLVWVRSTSKWQFRG